MTVAYQKRRKHSKHPNREQLCTPRSKRARALEAARREKLATLKNIRRKQ
jgi:hypothetical protein